VAEAVVGGALLLVLEDVVGLVDLLEPGLAVLVAGIAVRVPLHRELAIGGLEFAVGRGARHFEEFVVVGFGHASASPVANSLVPRRNEAVYQITTASPTLRDGLRPPQDEGHWRLRITPTSSCRRALR
jgi:hypothetical protein